MTRQLWAPSPNGRLTFELQGPSENADSMDKRKPQNNKYLIQAVMLGPGVTEVNSEAFKPSPGYYIWQHKISVLEDQLLFSYTLKEALIDVKKVQQPTWNDKTI